MKNIKVLYINIIFISELVFTGCFNTEGTLIVAGKVIDDGTSKGIPGRNIIVQGLVNKEDKLVPTDACQFFTDSSGCFSYKMKMVRGAYYYNFCTVGDSDYASKIRKLGLPELKNGKLLSLSLNKLVDITINIYRKSKVPRCDTLSLMWQSDGIYYNNIYPYKIENYGEMNNFSGPTPDLKLEWIGGKVISTIKTKVYANKMTRLQWKLIRNNERQRFTDTITCRRDSKNVVNFTY